MRVVFLLLFFLALAKVTRGARCSNNFERSLLNTYTQHEHCIELMAELCYSSADKCHAKNLNTTTPIAFCSNIVLISFMSMLTD